MRKHTWVSAALTGALALGPVVGCEGLPGKPKEQGAVIGGAGGALAGAAVAKNNRGLGALIGGVLGAGGGYLIGAQKEKIDSKKKDEAVAAHRRAEQNPAKPEDVDRSRTADLNDDGFVTLDEVVAMQRANLNDREMLDRLERTGQVFQLTDEQERYLEDRGVSREVVLAMRDLNQSDLARTASSRDDRLDDRRDAVSSSPDRIRENDHPRDFERVREAGSENTRSDDTRGL
jgi:hypothetical protein